MKIAALLIAALFVHASFASEATPSSYAPEWRLRKLSIHLRGYAPDLDEFDKLNLVGTQENLEKFFRKKTETYLKSPEHVAKMNERLDELFRLKFSRAPGEKYFTDIFSEKTVPSATLSRELADNPPIQFNALDSLFREIAAQNESFDQLLLGSDYRGFTLVKDSRQFIPGFNAQDDAGFFNEWIKASEINPTEFPDVTQTTYQANNKEDARIAGALTSNRFFQRYTDTSTNLNRRRAAAVFNIFLCDEMRPVQVPNKSDDQAFIDESLAAPSAAASSVLSEHALIMARAEHRHASDPSCASCHYKLDPMAALFQGFGSTLPRGLTSGALIYKIQDREVNVPVRGMRNMAKAILAQKEYKSCQVKHFWNWFIGSDIPLSSAREAELISEFDSVGHKVNSFISYLVNQPEFYTEAQAQSPQVLMHAKALSVLKDCNTCHASAGGPPDFTVFPIDGTDATHEKWIGRIADSLDLAHASKNAIMPPVDAGWDKAYEASATEIIRSWICMSAPDAAGKPTLSKLPEGVCKLN